MSYLDEYNKLKKKRREQLLTSTMEAVKSENTKTSTNSPYLNTYNQLKAEKEAGMQKIADMAIADLEIAPVGEVKEKKTFLDRLSNLGTAYAKGQYYLNGGAYQSPEQQSAMNDFFDKATVKSKEDEKKWFNSGLFKDGYQFGDVSKTILGTGADLAEDALTGIIGMGERIVDAGAYVAPLITQGQFYQNGGAYQSPEVQKAFNQTISQAKKDNAEFMEKDLYDANAIAKKLLAEVPGALQMSNINQAGGYATAEDWERNRQMQAEAQQYLDETMENESVLGEKSDALAQSAGQLAATMALQGLGVPWWLTTGATSFGAEAENALKQGATYEEAGLSATITAGAEILTEKISGGIKFGGKTLDEGLTRQLSRVIADKTMRTLAKIGMDVAGEGGEEVLSGYLSAIGQKLTYADEKTMGELFSSEDALDAFIGGAILGGVSSTGQAVVESKKGNDYASSLTDNEKAVVDKVYQDAIAQQEADGKSLSQREKSKIYDETLKALEKGYIDTDTIESVIGGETYNTYKSTVESEDALQKEYDELYHMKNGEKSDAQRDRQAELKKQLDEIKTNSNRTQLREQLDNDMQGLVQGSKLAESYNEKARRKQKFEADLDSYANENAKQTVKNFMEKTKANNTNRAHDYVDFLTRISEDRGHTFDFMTTAQMEESIKNGNPYNITADPKRVEAFVSGKDKTIIINMDANKSFSSLVGHETAHTLEGAGLYDGLQEVVFKLAETKGEFKDRLASIQRRYGNLSEAEQHRELTADLLGDYIFSDTDFIKSLSTEKPNILKRIYNEIKYLYKMATAGSQEARELERVKKTIEKVWRENSDAATDTKYSLNKVTDEKVADRLTPSEWKFVKSSVGNHKNLNYSYQKSADGDIIIPVGNKLVYTDANYDSPGISKVIEFESEYENDIDMAREEFYAVEKGKSTIEEAYEVVRLFTKIENINEYETENRANDGKYDRRTSRGKGQSDTFHNNFLQERIRSANEIIHSVNNENINQNGKASSKDGVFFDAQKDGVKYSISDSDGKQLSEDQQNYFKDSKVRDDNGSLKVMYHGTEKGGFHKFNPGYANDGRSLFFTDSPTVAKAYSGTHDTYAAKTFKTAEDFNRFFKEISATEYRVVEENGKFTLFDGEEEVATTDTADALYEEFRDWSGVGYGSTNYQVYLNLKNPLIVDAKGENWDSLDMADYDNDLETIDVYEFYVEQDGWDLEKDVPTFKVEAETSERTYDEIMYEEDIYKHFGRSFAEDLVGRAKDDFEGYSIWKNHRINKDTTKNLPSKTRDFAEYAMEKGYDGVIFKNIVDNGLYASNMERFATSTVAVAFDSNQVKSVENANPTSDPDIRYSLSEDSEGRALSPEDKWKFADSKLVDDNGSLKVMYHGTPNGDFTEFRAGTYFTENKEYADRYQSPSASSISSGKVASNPKTFAAYLNVKKPFDLSDAEARDIYINDYIKGGNAIGINPYLSDAEYEKITTIDWTEGEDLRDFLIDNGYDYDGLVLDEGADGGYGDEVVYRGKSYMIFYPEQVQIIDDSPRYSLSDNEIPLEQRLSGDALLDAQDLMDEISNVAEISPNGYVTLYHRTTEENANKIMESGKMSAKEDGIFFSTKEFGDNSVGYGGSVVKVKIPVEKLVLDDIFSDEAHLRIPLKNRNAVLDVSNYLVKPDAAKSLSETDIAPSPQGGYNLFKDIALEQDIAPIDEIAPTTEEIGPLAEVYAPLTEAEANERDDAQIDSKYFLDQMAPEPEAPIYNEDAIPESPFDDRDFEDVGSQKVKAYMYENPEVKPFFQEEARSMLYELDNSVKGERVVNANMLYDTGGEFGVYGTKRLTSEAIAYLRDSKYQYTYDQIRKGLNAIIEDHGAENNAISKRIEFLLDERLREGYTDKLFTGERIPPNQEYLNLLTEKQITEYNDEAWDNFVRGLSQEDMQQYIGPEEEIVQPVQSEPEIGPVREDVTFYEDAEGQQTMFEVEDAEVDESPLITKTRKDLRKALLESDKGTIIDALESAKNLSKPLMNNTDTIRVNEMVFGREAGKKINELIFQKEIDNEAKSISWQNQQRKEIKALGIKPRSKESAAVQKWGEGEYIDNNGNLVEYTDKDLQAEFPNVETQNRIKNAAMEIRRKYDDYLESANAVLTGLGFKPIAKRNNYFMHFQELGDFFSKNGIPFNPQSMQENDLPTDINGITEYFVPQKKFFASMNQRKGKRTVYDGVAGIDKYISQVADLIYHTEDIQRGRAFEELIRDTYGQGSVATENRLKLPEEQQAERLRKQQENHLSKYVSWLHQWTDNLAGKKNRIDRVFEDISDRVGFSVLDTARKQVAANMLGFNLSSSLTNFISAVQATAKTNKVAVARGTADTIKNIIQKDDFVSKNTFLTNRFGTDMLTKNAWQKMQDAGFIFMKGIDWFASNQIVRSKYYELTSKGMSEAQAHDEAGKFAARIMGDRTKGANAMFFNSKLFNVVGQFQLEVNNQLYSMFYDTYQESKEKAKGNAVKTAAGMTFTLGQLFAFTHLFGKTFESVAGYNPTLDVVGVLMSALGLGDDEDEEKTTSDRLKEAAEMLVDGLPYMNLFTDGGRIPLSSGIPNLIGVATGAKDQYNNELELGSELKKGLYMALPTGYGQIKKTYQGLKMFDDDLPIAGSYTDSGNLRFPVEDTLQNRVQAGIFGQWASDNARDYFDNERNPLKEKQIEELVDLDMPIADYWEYREGLAEQETLEDKFDYIAGLDVSVEQKNIMINNVVDRKEDVDMSNYDDFSGFEEFDFYSKNTEKYNFLQDNGVSYSEYISSEEGKKEYDNAYSWYKNNPEKVTVSKAVAGNVIEYRRYTSELNDIRADKDADGDSITGSAKEKKIAYINELDLDYGQKIILLRSLYDGKEDKATYNADIVEYLNGREDITYEEMVTILEELDMTVYPDGTVEW